jgi:hypothetical protein
MDPGLKAHFTEEECATIMKFERLAHEGDLCFKQKDYTDAFPKYEQSVKLIIPILEKYHKSVTAKCKINKAVKDICEQMKIIYDTIMVPANERRTE